MPPILLITDIPCMVQPIADRLHPGLLEDGGRLPRGPDGAVSIPALQHLGSAARDADTKHTLRVPPGGHPTSPCEDNVYAAYDDAEPSPRVQTHVDFRKLLLRAAGVPSGAGGGNGVGCASHQGIRKLAETHLHSLQRLGFHAMTLFDVVVVFAQWFAAPAVGGDVGLHGQAHGLAAEREGGGDATPERLPGQEGGVGGEEVGRATPTGGGGAGGGEATPTDLQGGGGGAVGVGAGTAVSGAEEGVNGGPGGSEGPEGGGDATRSALEEGSGGGAGGSGDVAPSEEELSKLSQSERQAISTFLMKVLAVAVGSTSTGGLIINAPSFLKLALYEDDQGAGGPTLRPLSEAVVQYHMVSEILHHARMTKCPRSTTILWAYHQNVEHTNFQSCLVAPTVATNNMRPSIL